MAIKELKLLGKTIYLHAVRFKQKNLEDCDASGKPVTKKMEGGRSVTKYYNEAGTEIPKSSVFKSLELASGETKAVSKLKQTKVVDKVEKIETNIDEELRGYQEVELLYVINTHDASVIDDILNKGFSYRFGFTNGNGFKLYKAYITRLKGKIVMYGCLGNALKKIDSFQFDEEIEIEESIVDSAKEEEVMAMLDY